MVDSLLVWNSPENKQEVSEEQARLLFNRVRNFLLQFGYRYLRLKSDLASVDYGYYSGLPSVLSHIAVAELLILFKNLPRLLNDNQDIHSSFWRELTSNKFSLVYLNEAIDHLEQIFDDYQEEKRKRRNIILRLLHGFFSVPLGNLEKEHEHLFVATHQSIMHAINSICPITINDKLKISSYSELIRYFCDKHEISRVANAIAYSLFNKGVISY
jgi:hypothetical protein